jgi:hypothetical protein
LTVKAQKAAQAAKVQSARNDVKRRRDARYAPSKVQHHEMEESLDDSDSDNNSNSDSNSDSSDVPLSVRLGSTAPSTLTLLSTPTPHPDSDHEFQPTPLPQPRREPKGHKKVAWAITSDPRRAPKDTAQLIVKLCLLDSWENTHKLELMLAQSQTGHDSLGASSLAEIASRCIHADSDVAEKSFLHMLYLLQFTLWIEQ